MTVSQLLNKLKGMPKDAKVACTWDDNGPLEIQFQVSSVSLVDMDEEREKHISVAGTSNDFGLTGKYVILN